MVPAISFTLLHFGPFDSVFLCEFFQFFNFFIDLMQYIELFSTSNTSFTNLNEFERKLFKKN